MFSMLVARIRSSASLNSSAGGSREHRPEPPGESEYEAERELRHRCLTVVRHVADGDVPLPAGIHVDVVKPGRYLSLP